MEPIQRKQLEADAAAFAKSRIAFLEQENAKSSFKPLIQPNDRRSILELLYTRFVSRYREVAP
jgi:hypothetical protein